MKLVQFEDGTYGIRRYWLFGWHFQSKHIDHNWRNPEDVDNFCKYRSLDEATNDFNASNRKYTTKHKVIE